MGVCGILARLLAGDETTVIVECRQCGAAVDPETDECSMCEATEFSKYEISS
jgi:uncharacterized OB-fold protein